MQDEIKLLREQVAEIQTQQARMSQSTQTLLARSLSLGGFFENSATELWGAATPTQFIADHHRLGINLNAELNDNFRLVTQVAYGFTYSLQNEHNNTAHSSSSIPLQREYGSLSSGVLLSQAYAEYSTSNRFRIMSGMGYSPFGYAFQVREPILFMKRRGPQLLRTNGVLGVVIADPFWEGVNFLYSPSSCWNFNLYSNTGLDHSGRMGGGLRIEYTENQLAVGVSGQASGQDDGYYRSVGAHFKFESRRVGFLGEWAKNFTNVGSPDSFYLQPYLYFYERRWTIFAMADYLRNPLGVTNIGTSSVNDPYIKWEYSLGFVYRVIEPLRLRWEITRHDYVGETAFVNGDDRDYFSTTISTGVSF